MIRRLVLVTIAVAGLGSSLALAEVVKGTLVKGTVVSVKPLDGSTQVIVRLKDSGRQVVTIIKSYNGKLLTPKLGGEIQIFKPEVLTNPKRDQ